jgi:hypothetical protein
MRFHAYLAQIFIIEGEGERKRERETYFEQRCGKKKGVFYVTLSSFSPQAPRVSI